VSADRVIVTTGSSGRIHPGVSGDVRAGRPRRHRHPGYRRIATPHRARLRAGADRDGAATGFAITGENLAPRTERKPLAGVLVAKPPIHRHDDDARRASQP